MTPVDHCTHWFDGWWGDPYCAAHDLDYAAGVARQLADGRLAACVLTSLPDWAAAHPALVAAAGAVSASMSVLMWAGVRLFGRRYYDRARR